MAEKREHAASAAFCAFLLLVGVSVECASVAGGQHQRIFFKDLDKEASQVPKQTYAQIGGQAMLECEAGGTPAPLIHWLRNGQRIDQGGVLTEILRDEEALSQEHTATNSHLSTLQLSATRSRLYIDCVSQSDAGIYVCVAETPTRRIAIEHTLKIDHNVVASGSDLCLRGSQQPVLIPARIFMWTVHRVELQGADVQLYCRSTGSGPVKITWYDRNGDAITKHDSQYQVLESGDLVVKSVNWTENMGLYRCTAEIHMDRTPLRSSYIPLPMRNTGNDKHTTNGRTSALQMLTTSSPHAEIAVQMTLSAMEFCRLFRRLFTFARTKSCLLKLF